MIRHLKSSVYKATVAGLFIPSGDIAILSIGVALCTPEDNFSRVTGRNLALARATKSPIFNLVVKDEKDAKLKFHKLVDMIEVSIHFGEGVNSIKTLLESSHDRPAEAN